MIVVIIGIVGSIAQFGRHQCFVFHRRVTFGRFTFARSLVVFSGIEQEMQPRHHLFD
jgi:hypothetical protein